MDHATPAPFARSSVYSSDVAKMINCPVLHVNGDHPEGSWRVRITCINNILFTFIHIDVIRAVQIAFEYRNKFRKDIVIDLIVYRRWYVLVSFLTQHGPDRSFL